MNTVTVDDAAVVLMTGESGRVSAAVDVIGVRDQVKDLEDKVGEGMREEGVL
jgi:hypothetical protein